MSTPKKKRQRLPHTKMVYSGTQANKRVLEFPVLIHENGVLSCSLCKKAVSCRKDIARSHCSSKKHVARMEAKDIETVSDNPQEEFVLDFSCTLLRAGLSFQKIDDFKPFLMKWTRLGGAIPSSDSFRQNHLRGLIELHEKSIAAHYRRATSFSLSLDETPDARGEAVMNIIAYPFSVDLMPVVPHLTDVCFVPTDQVGSGINGKLTADVLFAAVIKYLQGKPLDAFVTDGAAYNYKAVKYIRERRPDLKFVHIWCNSHMLDRVGNKFRTLPTVKASVGDLLKRLIKLFGKSRTQRRKWYQHLERAKELKPQLKPKTIPQYNTTRWATWFNTAFHVLEYWDELLSFASSAPKDPKSKNLASLSAFLGDEEKKKKSKVQLVFIKDQFSSMVTLIMYFQTNSGIGNRVYPAVQDLLTQWSTEWWKSDALIKHPTSMEYRSDLDAYQSVFHTN